MAQQDSGKRKPAEGIGIKYRYLLWDVDGTVLDFLAAEKAAVKALFRKFGFGVCTDEMVALYSAINVRYWQALERNEMTKPQILVGRFREFFSTVGVSPDQAEAFNADYQLALGDTIVFRDHTMEVLQALKGRFVLCAVTNGTKAAQQKKLSLYGLDRVFDRIFISEEIGIEKPNPGFFRFVFDTLGDSDPSRYLIIGDSLTSDIRGGNNAGIDTCWYAPANAVCDKEVTVTYRVSDLSEVPGIVL